MKITEAINEFKRILNLFEKNKEGSTFLCLNSNNNEFKDLFKHKNGTYYINYVGFSALDCPYKVYTEKCKQWKIRFMKKEIKELTTLLKKGYTDI